jgi:hypothetical protein
LTVVADIPFVGIPTAADPGFGATGGPDNRPLAVGTLADAPGLDFSHLEVRLGVGYDPHLRSPPQTDAQMMNSPRERLSLGGGPYLYLGLPWVNVPPCPGPR